jgi:hypothetical protein
MKVAILQSNYIPWRGYFDLINDVDVFVFYDCVKYTKNDWRNRNVIYTKNGKQWLTIPVPASATKLVIDEVILPDTRWQKIHAKSLSIGYGKAPHFDQLDEIINEFLIDHDWKSLADLNQQMITRVSRRLGCTTVFRDAREFTLAEDRVDRLLGIMKALGATEYISGPAAAAYLDGKEHLFHDLGIRLTYKYYRRYSAYRQLQQPYEPAVSILDAIANLPWSEIPNHIWAE